ncbi:hypothetical protein N7520_009473 [Penicillium odoratum]|uniref:uncharacterized protein n=1 Tax=Penicillium odoratum TaxID=1167516 RepID=UPI0025476303|nr:uncharacterized protein N7520_009473 [Penicillium odoratum]KAJ5752556.1 hypothetical protein N7520_009473 [Penicillium odoratum]
MPRNSYKNLCIYYGSPDFGYVGAHSREEAEKTSNTANTTLTDTKYQSNQPVPQVSDDSADKKQEDMKIKGFASRGGPSDNNTAVGHDAQESNKRGRDEKSPDFSPRKMKTDEMKQKRKPRKEEKRKKLEKEGNKEKKKKKQTAEYDTVL